MGREKGTTRDDSRRIRLSDERENVRQRLDSNVLVPTACVGCKCFPAPVPTPALVPAPAVAPPVPSFVPP